MTGKEALKLAQDTILAHNGNNKSSFTMKMLYQVEAELNEKDKKLTKYKRAFEILKDEFGLEIKECCDKYKKAFKKDYQITSYSHRVFVTKDVAELLEELMSDGKIN